MGYRSFHCCEYTVLITAMSFSYCESSVHIAWSGLPASQLQYVPLTHPDDVVKTTPARRPYCQM